jgi:tRNA pseudouridine38-40 synthase
MSTYKVIVAYDGTQYAGWQQQPQQRSIIGTLATSFKRAFKHDVKLLGASRTDAGVHAMGQVMRCVTSLALDPQKLMFAWNNSLPNDIRIRQAFITDDAFSPRASVKQKTYYYHLFMRQPLPFLVRYGWYHTKPICLERLAKALQQCVGTHNFRSFCSAEEKCSDVVRTIDAITVTQIQKFGVCRIAVSGPRFLRHMIRRVVGAAVAVASNTSYSVDVITQTLARKDPHHLLPNAPSKGLMLYRILYQEQGNYHVQ